MRSSRTIWLLGGSGALLDLCVLPGRRQFLQVLHTAQTQHVLMQCRAVHLTPVVRVASEGTSTRQPAGSGTAEQTAGGDGATALDVAMRVNKLKRLHQTGGGPNGKKHVELDAWGELNSLTEAQINCAEGKAVSLLLNSWAYFAKYWEKGAEGPSGGGLGGSAPLPSSSSGTGKEGNTSEGNTL